MGISIPSKACFKTYCRSPYSKVGSKEHNLDPKRRKLHLEWYHLCPVNRNTKILYLPGEECLGSNLKCQASYLRMAIYWRLGLLGTTGTKA